MIACTSGHRPKYFPGVNNVKERMYIAAFAALGSGNIDKLICGMASGWDLSLGECAHVMGIPLICARPWPTHKPDLGDGHRYNKLLMQAEEVVEITDGSVNFNAAFEMRNRWMVDHSDIVLALYIGVSSGTQRCLVYAEKRNKLVRNFYDAFKAA